MAKKKKPSDHGLENVENVLSKTERYIEENQKSLTIIVIVIAVIIGGYLGYKKLFLAPTELEAQSEMYVAEKYFEADSFRLALEGDGSYLGFIDIIDEYGITKCANLAKYYAGVCHLKLGEYEDAIEYLKKFDSDDVLVASIALGAIGDAYVELGELEEGVEFYLKAAERKKNDFTSAVFLKKAGLVYEELGDYKKALELYEKIENQFPKSEESRDIEKYITGMKIKLKS
ncbi:MAG: tetratricopeptide repeat protein [Bacteroidales bacterium]|nr:MAG: tetratricopeptide repeat protein [Bacteroidales bacterium]